MSSSIQATSEFTGIRKAIWPIHNHELKKFIPLGLIMFTILFIYTMVRDIKDTLVVTAAGAGLIPFLKFYCVTPSAVLFVIMYAKLCNVLNREMVFYTVIAPFLVFFGAFGLVIYPNITALHPSPESIASLHAAYPNFSGFINIYAYWAYSLFYVLAELWGSAMIGLMFWQFANQIVRMSESKRFYGLFVVIGNVSLIFSGQFLKLCSQDLTSMVGGSDPWKVSLYAMMSGVVVMGLACMGIYRWMNTTVIPDPIYVDPPKESTTKAKKKKPTLMESFKLIAQSPEIGLIAMLIICYGVTINLVEVQWKEQLKLYFGADKGAYNAFMGDFSTWTGIITILFALFVGNNLLRVLGWFKAAAITPLVIMVGASTFFSFVVANMIPGFGTLIEGLLAAFALSPAGAATFLGAFIVVGSKATKYSLFDPTKEMAYIPLREELKSQGKAAVDVVGGRAGKAGGAFVQSTMLALFATTHVVAIGPYTIVIFLIFCVIWLISAKALNKRIEIATGQMAAETAKTTTSASALSTGLKAEPR